MNYQTAFGLWNVLPPSFIDEIKAIPADQELIVNGLRHSIPWPTLSPEELVSAFHLLDDWEIPKHLIPIAGNFHDLLCVDISQNNEIVVLDDSRDEVVRFHDIAQLVKSLRTAESSALSEKIIKSKSWLDF
jgi:hypothetical protein